MKDQIYEPQPIDTKTSEPEKGRAGGYVSRMRKLLFDEAKLTFSLPRLGDGIIKDVGMKGLGAANIYVGNFLMKGAEYMDPEPSTDSLPYVTDETFMTEIFPNVITALGVTAIFMANRSRYRPKDD